MNLKIEIEQEEDGRFIAEVIDFPGVLVLISYILIASR
jgi:predicted RNase H-like HicB family nuclease